MNKVIILSGAGFCVPLNLPQTTEFGKLLPEGTNLSAVLNSHLGKHVNDVEYVLSSLEQLVDNRNLFSSLFKWYSENWKPEHYVSTFNGISAEARAIIKRIKQDTFNVLRSYKSEQAHKLYSNLLNEVYDNFTESSISFFTTNYDLTFEDAIDEYDRIKSVDYGFTQQGRSGRYIFSGKDNWDWPMDSIEYKKLHGSLDWNTDGNRLVRMVSSVIPENAAIMPILYPGYKDVPSVEPFLSFHNQLMTRLFEADYVICIGFAFRDPYINSLFNMALNFNQKLTVFCYNPAPKENLPPESAIPSLSKNKRFHHIEKGISLEKNSLGLKSEAIKMLSQYRD